MRKGSPYGKMSSSDRSRNSKWDSKEESRIALENMHNRELRDLLSPEAAADKHSKWSVTEPLPGRRASCRDDSIDEDRNRNIKGMTAWEEEDSYGTKMSPGLDDWRQQSHNRSPKKKFKRSRSPSQSRSRSKSPVRGFFRELGLNDRSRSRSGQVCKDYSSGWCRRGSHCQFLHDQTNEDSWERQRRITTPKYPMSSLDSREYPTGSGKSTNYCTEFLKGSCRRGSSCRFAHHGASHDAAGKISSDEAARGRNNDRGHRDDQEPRRATGIPCKFFGAGNCRNGNHCRFSHQDQTYPSPDKSREGRVSLDRGSADVANLYTMWGFSSDGENIRGDKGATVGATSGRETARSVDNTQGHCMEQDKKLNDLLIDDRIVENEILQWRNADDSKLASEQRVGEKWLGDMDMSPEWNYKVQTSKPIDTQASIADCNSNMIEQATTQMHAAAAVFLPSETNELYAKPPDFNFSALPHDDKSMPITPGSHGIVLPDIISVRSFNQNGWNSNALPPTGLSPVGQAQVAVFSNSGGIRDSQMQMDEKAINEPDIVKPTSFSQLNHGVGITLNNVSNEQLTTISASIAHLLAQNMMETSPFDNKGPIKKDSENMGMQKQYDPTSDSIEVEKHEVSNNPPGFFPTPNMQKNIADVTASATHSNNNNKISVEGEANDKSCEVIQLEPASKENHGVVTKESTNLEEHKDAKDNGPLENIAGDEKAEDGKKGKDTKAVKAFKFALVEFVKEVLKPAWKEGQMSKDAYKNIVKKVVEKVTGTVQGANMPQTQEKIQQYLSYSKPKLTKLVQAYVEKFQKDK